MGYKLRARAQIAGTERVAGGRSDERRTVTRPRHPHGGLGPRATHPDPSD